MNKHREEIEYRRMSSHDVDYLYELCESTMRGYVEKVWGQWNEVDLRKFFAQASKAGAFDEILKRQVRVGAIAVEDHASHLQLEQLYIGEPRQNLGIGTAVVRDLLARATSESKPVRLRVLRPNPAKRLYERLGFVVTEETSERYFMEHHV